MAKATTAKTSRTSLEPSEIFCAVGLIMPTSKMKTLCDDNTGAALLKWASGDGLTLLKGGKIDYNNEVKFEKMFTDQPSVDKKVEAYIANIVAGFSAAIGVKDTKWGERPIIIVARIVRENTKDINKRIRERISNEIKKGLLSKWAMPDKIEYVKEIEKTSVGKVNKKLLREKYKFIKTNEK